MVTSPPTTKITAVKTIIETSIMKPLIDNAGLSVMFSIVIFLSLSIFMLMHGKYHVSYREGWGRIYPSFLHIMGSFFIVELFDRIPQHGTRHRVVMLIQECNQYFFVTLANLTQHPADGFVNEIVFVINQDF